MSKSKGNVVKPNDITSIYGSEGLRYFLLREGTPHSDSNFSNTKIHRMLNAELADTLGNLLNRSCGRTVNQKQYFPSFERAYFDKYCGQAAKELVSIVETLQDDVKCHYNEMNFYKGINGVMEALHAGNRFFEASKPWELRKSSDSQHHLEIVLHLTMETLRIAGIALSPIVPVLSKCLLDKLNVHPEKRNWRYMKPSWLDSENSSEVPLSSEKSVLFRKIQ